MGEMEWKRVISIYIPVRKTKLKIPDHTKVSDIFITNSRQLILDIFQLEHNQFISYKL
jgi:hypothetical protein